MASVVEMHNFQNPQVPVTILLISFTCAYRVENLTMQLSSFLPLVSLYEKYLFF